MVDVHDTLGRLDSDCDIKDVVACADGLHVGDKVKVYYKIDKSYIETVGEIIGVYTFFVNVKTEHYIFSINKVDLFTHDNGTSIKLIGGNN